MVDMKDEFAKWWVVVVGLIVATGIVFTLLNYAGVIGGTIVERKVFENSYQYKEGNRARVNMFEAQLAEIDVQLGSDGLSDVMRSNLKAQRSAIMVQLQAARRSER